MNYATFWRRGVLFFRPFWGSGFGRGRSARLRGRALAQSSADKAASPLAEAEARGHADAPWRNVAAVRAYETWTRFVATDGADKDSSYHQVVAVLSALNRLG